MQKMSRKRKDLDPQTRSRLCELHSIGWGARKIHRKHPDIPISTIQSTIKLESTRVNNVSKPRPGRPRKLSEEQRKLIWDRVQADPNVTLQDLVVEVEGAVQKRSIRRLLTEMSMSKPKAKKVAAAAVATTGDLASTVSDASMHEAERPSEGERV